MAFGIATISTRGDPMHFEVLVEDKSGKKALDILIPKIVGDQHSFRVRGYQGLGHIPKGLASSTQVKKRLLLDQLPKLLRVYGRRFPGCVDNCSVAVIVVCDLDSQCQKEFRDELLGVLETCSPQPETRFCFAIEEGEAWLLGDLPAIKRAYPHAKDAILTAYRNDSICGTWEVLADAVSPQGANGLKAVGYPVVGQEKETWAERICPEMEVESNASPSFCYFRDRIRALSCGTCNQVRPM